MTGSIAAVVAHPDDESLIAGGTLALAASRGAITGIVSLTRGEDGPVAEGGPLTSEQLGAAREAELHAAGRVLGASWTICLPHPDGELLWIDHAAAAEQLAGLLAERDTAVVLTFGPDGLYWHPDHIATREIVLLAVAQLRRPAAVYEAAWPSGVFAQLVAAAAERGLPTGLWGLEPAAFGTDRHPTVSVDVRETLTQKLAALRSHRTQIGADHVLGSLPPDLAERFLAVEPWAGPETGELEELLAVG